VHRRDPWLHDGILSDIMLRRGRTATAGVYACKSALTHFAQSPNMGTVIKRFDTSLANRPFLVFDFRALWRSGLSASALKITLTHFAQSSKTATMTKGQGIRCQVD